MNETNQVFTHTCEWFEHKCQSHKLPLVLEYPLHGVSEEKTHDDNLAQVGGDEAHSHEKLYHHQPSWQQLLSETESIKLNQLILTVNL